MVFLLWSEFICNISVYLHFFVLIYLHITFIILIVYYISLICTNNIHAYLFVHSTCKYIFICEIVFLICPYI
jgi:hypothetical protein